MAGDKYKHALRYDWLTGLYDPVMRWTMREQTFKAQLVQQAQIQSGYRVLDLGAGTGTLMLMLKQRHPHATVVGLDGDPKALAGARAKFTQAGLDVQLDEGMSFALPYADGSFDRVVSSLLFHHLDRAAKQRTFGEVLRVLRPGGELHVADWGQARSPFLRGAFYLVQVLDGFDTTADNVRGLLPELMRAAGLDAVAETAQYATVFGPLSLYRARRPE